MAPSQEMMAPSLNSNVIATGIPLRSSHCEPLLPAQSAAVPAVPLALPGPAQPVEGATSDIKATPARITGSRVVPAFDKFRPHVETIRSGLRPWREFASLAKPAGFAYTGICNRLQVNLRYYRSNYAVGFLSFSIVALALNPQSLVVTCIIVLIWSTLSIRGYELGRPKQWLVLEILSGFVVLFVAGKDLLNAGGVAFNFILCHAMVHPSPEPLTAPTAESLTDSTDAVEALENGSADTHDLVLYPAVD